MNEGEQQRLIDRAEDIAATLITRALDIIASRGLETLTINVGKFQVEGAELKGSFTAYASDPSLISIRHLIDKRALFVLADPTKFFGTSDPATPDVVGELAIPKGHDPGVEETIGRGNGSADGLDIPEELRRTA